MAATKDECMTLKEKYDMANIHTLYAVLVVASIKDWVLTYCQDNLTKMLADIDLRWTSIPFRVL